MKAICAVLLVSAILGATLLWPGAASAADRAPTVDVDAPRIILAAEGGLPLTEVLRLEPGHLLALGAGIVVGAALIGPYIGVGEVVGVAVGVIAAELFYRSDAWPLDKPRTWFE